MAKTKGAADAPGTAIEPGIIGRLAGAARYLISGDTSGFFGPGQPLAPVAQEEVAGRQFDFPTAFNLNIRPRASEAIDFNTLRALADGYDLVRLAVETRKDQMEALEWEIVRVDGEELDKAGEAIQAFLQEPDREHDFGTWSRMLLEEQLVIDAPVVYIRRTNGGAPYALEQIDGATIARKLDGRGRTPLPPDPAYQQVIKGMPAVDYHTDELVYYPRNPRINRVYGFSPVEQIILIVNIALRRETSQLEYYSEGNIPDMLLNVPKEWTAPQVEKFQSLFDEVLAGDTAARRRIRFVPGDTKAQMLRPEPLFDMVAEEWLARVVMYCFSLPANAFTKQVNRATATTAQEVSLEEGLAPLQQWKQRLMNRIIRVAWRTADYQFRWSDKTDIDPKVQAEIDQIMLGGATGAGVRVRSVEEIREEHGWGPAPPEVEEANAEPDPVPGDGLTPPAEGAQGAVKTGAEKLAKARERRQRSLEEARAARQH